MDYVTIVSGGMDSVTLAHVLADGGEGQELVSFDYGQRHAKELAAAERCARRLRLRWSLIDLREPLGAQLSIANSALTNPEVDVPHGHYAADTMRLTIVPNRNLIMLAIAAGVARARGLDAVAYAAHTGDHTVYPDCRPEFVDAAREAIGLGTFDDATGQSIGLLAPFIDIDKAEIARIGERRGVPWAETWSCYEGGEFHCGRCGTCVERREAFAIAEVNDPTKYASD